MDGIPIDTGLKWLPHLSVQPLLGQLIVALALVAVAFLARDAFRLWLADRAAARLGKTVEAELRDRLLSVSTLMRSQEDLIRALGETGRKQTSELVAKLFDLTHTLENLTKWGETVDARLTERASEFRMAIAEWAAALSAVKAEVDTKIQHAQSRVDGSVAAVHELGTSSWRKPG